MNTSPNRFWRRALLLLVLGAAAVYVFLSARPTIFRFADLAGPAASSPVAAPLAASIASYGEGAPSRLAILVTDPDSGWLGLAHGLKTIGVPFVLTQDVEQALRHKVVVVYPTISGKVLSQAALQALALHPRKGGTLVGFEILGGGLNEIFGFSEFSASRARATLRFEAPAARAFGLEGKAELELPLSGPAGAGGTYGYTLSSGTALARYPNGEAAIVQRNFGAGNAYAVGVDVGAYIAKAYNGRQDLGRNYINAFEPAVDVFLRTLRQIYRAAEPMAVTLETVPDGKRAAVILTHDIDFTRSIENAVAYAEHERAQGVAATYFIQTKYVKDWNDEIFFNARGAALTRQLSALRMEVASHSVSHSRVFSKFTYGDGAEAYPAYVPFVKSKLEAQGGSIQGELRVSRFLLEYAVPGLQVQSFRPGHLEYPFALPQALQANAYRFSSSISSGTALTHLPFQLNYNRENAAETPVFEFPITIEDELARPMTARFDATLTILDQLSRYGGTCVVLIHPDVFDDKFAFLKALIGDAKRRDLWLGSLQDFGRWWAARNQVGLDVALVNGRYVVNAQVPAAAGGLTLRLPAGWQLRSQQLGAGKATQHGDTVRLTDVAGRVTLNF